jgi:type II secretory pathway component GspD/PulD (secretin)
LRATTNFVRRFLPLGILLAAGIVLAQSTLEIIPLRHRTAEQVIPILQPLLEPGGALSGQSYQLIVRTSPANLAQLRDVLAAIDRPARRLMISVRFDSVQDSARSRADADVRISSRGASADVRVLDSRSAQDERVDQRLQVLEGNRAFISAGESRPLRQPGVVRTPAGGVVQETVIQEAATGFEVAPRVSGSNVTLDIYTQQEAFAQRGAIRGQQASSTVSGRLGEWIELGGASSSAMSSGTGTLSSRQGARSSDRHVWLKVEEIR